MTRILAVLPLLLLFACKSGPDEVDASLFDTGFLPEKDAGEDAGFADTGTTAIDAAIDGAVNDGAIDDGAVNDGAITDGEALDGEIGDGAITDGEPGDGEPIDGDLMDGNVDPDATPIDPDGGAIDTGPQQLVEDFTDPVNEVFTCPDTTAITPGLAVENGTQCLGIDGSGCPDERGLPGPGSTECTDPAQNPFIGGGQCVGDFFSCFDPMGTCTNDGAGTFTWANGAMQTIMVDLMGRLVRSEFTPAGAAAPCIVGLPETAGGTRVIYTQQ